jgi:hypothetical protein
VIDLFKDEKNVEMRGPFYIEHYEMLFLFYKILLGEYYITINPETLKNTNWFEDLSIKRKE